MNIYNPVVLIMKSSTYAFLIFVTFLRNLDKKYAKSITQVINITDKIAKTMGYKVDLPFQTKYHIVKTLLKDGILVKRVKGKEVQIGLSSKVKKYLEKFLENRGFEVKIHITTNAIGFIYVKKG